MLVIFSALFLFDNSLLVFKLLPYVKVERLGGEGWARKRLDKVKDGGDEFTVHLVETFFSNLDLV